MCTGAQITNSLVQGKALCNVTGSVGSCTHLTSFMHKVNAQNSKEKQMNIIQQQHRVLGTTHRQGNTCEACSCISCKTTDVGIKIQRDLFWYWVTATHLTHMRENSNKSLEASQPVIPHACSCLSMRQTFSVPFICLLLCSVCLATLYSMGPRSMHVTRRAPSCDAMRPSMLPPLPRTITCPPTGNCRKLCML